jgi:hypothetical protein
MPAAGAVAIVITAVPVRIPSIDHHGLFAIITNHWWRGSVIIWSPELDIDVELCPGSGDEGRHEQKNRKQCRKNCLHYLHLSLHLNASV